MLNFFKHSFFIVFFLFSTSIFSQICGTPGGDGPITVSSSVNTYYPVDGNITLNAGGQSIKLAAVPKMDAHKNDFGTTPISVGDLILIIQMQDATIDYRNNNNYGSGTSNSGPDLLGGTGFTDIGNTGIFEYVIATNNVPLSGGNLTFKGTAVNGGTSNSYFNAEAAGSRGKRTFQIVRVPQYSNLTLTKDITTPPFNGIAGGVIAFNVSGNFNFSNFSINGTARGFRGGYSPKADSGKNNSTTYVGDVADIAISGKGEGIAGTPRFMWDGYNEVNNGVEGMPEGSAGRGAPANAGGGGNDHNSGGGGGGNGGFGGLGGYGWQGAGGDLWSATPRLTGAGRPGFKSYRTTNPELIRLIMGGGGGAGDANNATNGVKGGVGGAIVLINAGAVIGPGKIEVNGGPGAAGTFQSSSDGAGGAGAGGTVLLNISGATTGGKIIINANGGNGGHTDNDTKNEHGPGGGGGGGIIRHNIAPANVVTSVIGGLAGLTNGTGTNNHGAMQGTGGYVATFANNEMPPNLQVNSKCFPILDTTVKALPIASACGSIDAKVSYEIQITNTGIGNAAGVVLDFAFPTNIGFDSATVKSLVSASGPSGTLTNTGTSNKPLLGVFNIAKDGVVTITLVGKVTGSIAAGTYSSNAQALYLDPTRTTGNDTRKITAFIGNSGGVGVFTSYQGANQENVPGSNFNGDVTGVTIDDIKILALPATPTTTVTPSSCTVPTGTIRVDTPANGPNIFYTIKGTNPVTEISNDTGVFAGLAPNTYVVTTTNSDGCISLPTNGIVINAVAGAPITKGASVCQGSTSGASLTATSTSCTSTNIQWYLDAVGGAVIFTGSSFNPITTNNSGLTAASAPQTKTYYAACPNSTCRTATDFVINAVPTITSITAASRCDAGTVLLKATASAGTINWYNVATGGASIGTGSEFTTPSLSASKDYYVAVTDNGCSSARTLVRATVNASPTIISTTQASRCGTGELTLKATVSAGATINWYASPTSESILETGPEFKIPNLSTTTTYYVGATTAEGCTTTSRIAVAAVINTGSTIVLTSGMQSPAVCPSTAIPTTVYTFGGSATNAIVTDLPAELKWDVDSNAKTVTISGTPTTSGTYTITTIGHTAPCVEAIIRGTVTINASIPLPTASAVTQPTCAVATGSFIIDNYNSSYTYTITPSLGVDQKGNTITAPAGSYKLTAKSGSCTSGASANIVVNVQPATPDRPIITTTAATCSVASSSTIDNYVAGNTYTFAPTGPTVSGTGLINNMVIGTGYTVTSKDANCTSVASASFSNAVQLATPDRPIITTTAATCSAASSSKIDNYVAGNTYTFSPTGPTVSSTGLISNMVIGTAYTVTSKDANCTSVVSASFSNAAQLATPDQPIITTTAATCSAASSSTIDNYVAGNTYTFAPTGPTVSGTGLINNMVIGTGYTVTSKDANCTSVASASFSNAAQLATPDRPIITTTAATCSAASSSTIDNYVAGNTYAFAPTGPTVSGTGLINNMVIGTGYTVTSKDANCTSVASASFSNAAQLATPDRPIITTTAATCSAASSSTIDNYVAGNTYTFAPTGPTVSGTGLVSNMVIGTAYTVTSGDANCTSVASASFSNATQLATPDRPIITTTAATCSATSSSTIDNYVVGNTYTFAPAGPTVSSTGLISNMVIGTAYTVTSKDANCTSVASVSFSNAAQLATPDRPIITTTAATCSAASSSTIDNYVTGNTYTFAPTGPTVSGTGLISNMVIGTGYTVTSGDANCTSVASASFSNAAQLATPDRPIITTTAATCSAASSSTIDNYVAGNTYTFAPTGPTVSGTGLISNMVIGTGYTVTSGDANCTSVASASFSNAAQLATPDRPIIATTAATCSAASSSTIDNYVAGNTYTFAPTGPTVSGTGLVSNMVIGTGYTVTSGDANCTSVASASFSNAAQLATPDRPIITTTAATCSAASSSTIDNYVAGNTYTFAPTGPTVSSTGLISNMVIGTGYTVTSGDANCTSVASASFSNAAQLATPDRPIITTTAATCSVASSSTIDNYVTGNTYTFAPTGPTVSGTGLVSNMVIGTGYTVTSGDANCTSVASASFSNAAQLATPDQPIITTTAATCSAASSSTIDNYVAGNTYTFAPTGPTVSSTGLVSNMVIGTGYTVTSGDANCTSVASASFSNAAQLATPDQPIITTTAATCSAASSSTIDNYVAGNIYTFDPVGPTVDTSGLISNMVIGTGYTVTSGDINCTSVASASFRNAAQLATPAQPTIRTTPATCLVTVSSTIDNYVAGNVYTFDPVGPTVDTSGLISNMVIGTGYTVTSGDINCTSVASASFRNAAQLTTPEVPLLKVVTQPTCGNVIGSFSIENYDAKYKYDITPLIGVIQTGNMVTAPSGSYTIIATLGSCSSASSSAILMNNVICANKDTPAAINGKDGGNTTVSVLDNDTLNGKAVVSSEVTLTPKGTYPAGITLNADGTITVAAGTPADTYEVEYTICEKLNPLNCSSTTVTVPVTAAPIVANKDTPAAINGKDGGNTTVSVLDNDTLNGKAVVPSEVTLTPKGTYPTGITLNADGTITVAAGTPADTYEVEYTICEKLNPLNCSSTTVTVPVTAAPIVANKDTPAAINGKDGGNTTVSVLDNDTLNGKVVVSSEVTLTPKGTYPAGITLNADGTITVAPGTPADTYEVEYTICEKLNPLNCSSTTVTVLVTAAPIVANKDTPAAINGKDGGNTTVSVLDNDTLNGKAVVPSEVTLTPKGTYPAGITLNADGTITVAPGTPADTYEVEYTICEKLNPLNCSSTTVTVLVTAAPIVANKDTPAAINGKDGGNTTVSVLDNDTLNGKAVVPSEVTLTPKGTYPTGITLNADGTITVAAGTPADTYEVEYTICEKLNPLNCSSTTVTVPVTAAPIVANKDTPAAINGKDGGNTTVSVLDNDTLNGKVVVPSEVTLTPKGTYPTGITLNADGTITVAPGTPADTYEVEYTICEKLNPSNCSSTTVTVPVTAAPIVANKDTPAAINGKDGGNTTVSVLDNDTLNGKAVVPSEVTLTPKGTYPTGITLNADGTITVAAGTPADTYEVEYTICEKLNPLNCSSTTVTVPVTAAPIVANKDTPAAINGKDGGNTTVSVLDNDTLNGKVVVSSEVTLTPKGTYPAGITLNADGTITVAPGTPADTYEVEYTICEKLNPLNCSSTTVTVLVTAAPIVANKDTPAAINGKDGGNTTVSVLDNDTLNGKAVVPSEVTLTPKGTYPAGITLNADGTITVAPGTPADTYEVEYTICEKLNPLNCSSTTVTVLVTAAPIVANKDTPAAINGKDGGNTTVSVLDNDTLNGKAVVPSEVTLTPKGTYPTGITLNADGTITVAAGTPADTYEVEYTICEKLNPLNCSSTTVTVPVTAAPIVANKDTPAAINGKDGGNTTVSVLDNDTLNGKVVVPSEVTLTPKGTYPTGITLNADGTITVAPGTPADTYEVEYTICEKLNPSNCSSTIVKVLVEKPVINAVTETTDLINGITGGTTPPLTSNDILNGDKVVIGTNSGNVILTPKSVPTGLTLNPDGTVTVAPNTPAGNYNIEYQICEVTNQGNCDTVTSVVVVGAAVIDAVDDNVIFADGINGSLEVINVLDNDRLNGGKINNPAVVTLKSLTVLSGITLNVDGTIDVAPNTPGGVYTLTYEICDVINRSNCITAKVTIFVEVPSIAVVKTAVFNDENKSGYANAGETITYKFKITNTGNTPLLNVIIDDQLPGLVMSGGPITLGVNEVDENSFIGTYVIKQSDINFGKISNQATVFGTSANGITVEDISDNLSEVDDNPTVSPIEGCVIKVFNAISPNGDSQNERFYIQGLECYPNNTVEIYNRWGVLVFERDGYNNEERAFKGFSEGRTTVQKSEGLPVGTYYYVLKYKDSESNTHQKVGYLYINK